MKIEQHVTKAFDDVLQNEFDAGLLHACIALEGTARKYLNKDVAGAGDYKKLIRDYYWIIELMIGGGLNLEDTKWNDLVIPDHKGNPIPGPDFADIVYHIFRCSHAHSKEVPSGYGFLPTEDGKSYWRIADNSLYMPSSVVWALISVSVFAKANSDIKTDSSHFLTWGSESLGIGIHKYPISQSWGEEDRLKDFFSKQKIIRVKLEFPKS